MNLMKWDPFSDLHQMSSRLKFDPYSEMQELSNRLNRLFGRAVAKAESDNEMLLSADWTPAVDISETAASFLIKAEIPEVKKEDIKVTLDDGMLTIRGERQAEKDDKGRKFHRIERCYGCFVRSFRIPDDIDETAMKAEFKDGVLNITLPKTEKAGTKAINIAVS